MNALTRAKISRTALRNHCKKLEQKIDTLFQAFPADGLLQLKALKLNYKTQLHRIEVADAEVTKLLTTNEELEADISETLALSDVFYATLAKMDQRLHDEGKPTLSTGGVIYTTFYTIF